MKYARFAVAAFVLAFLPGCGSTAGRPAQTVLEGNRVVDYPDIASLSKASAAVLEVESSGASRLVPADQAGKSAIDATVTTMRVNHVIQGTLGAKEIELREIGDVRTAASELSPHFQGGRTYIIFVVPFTFHDGKSTGQYVLTDGSTAYRQDAAQLTSLAGDSGSLPASLSRAALVRESAVR